MLDMTESGWYASIVKVYDLWLREPVTAIAPVLEFTTKGTISLLFNL